MGTCITVIKVIGASSLGLLTGTMALEKYKAIPDLMARLNSEESIHSASGKNMLKKILTHVFTISGASIGLASLTSYLFSTAYKYSPLTARHPYLMYCALGAPLAVAALQYKSWGTEFKLLKRSNSYKAHVEREAAKKKKEEEDTESTAKTTGHNHDDEAQLGKSYIHVTNGSLSSLSTPGSSAPGSPQQKAQESSKDSSIIEEVEEAMNKKVYVGDLEKLTDAYSFALPVSGAAFAVSLIGLVGDLFFV